jgi:hypothetical protein
MTCKLPIELSAACKHRLATEFDDASRARAFGAIERWLRTPEAYPPSPIDDAGCTVTVGGVILEIRESPLGGIVIGRIVLAAGGPISSHCHARSRNSAPPPGLPGWVQGPSRAALPAPRDGARSAREAPSAVNSPAHHEGVEPGQPDVLLAVKSQAAGGSSVPPSR